MDPTLLDYYGSDAADVYLDRAQKTLAFTGRGLSVTDSAKLLTN